MIKKINRASEMCGNSRKKRKGQKKNNILKIPQFNSFKEGMPVLIWHTSSSSCYLQRHNESQFQCDLGK